MGGLTAPVWEAYPGQINAVAPAVELGSTVEVIVITECGMEGALQSMPGLAIVADASPEFLYFAHNANGQNPVEAVNSVSGAFVGPEELGPDFAPALPGDLVTIFASELGPTDPPIRPGAVSSVTAQVTSPVTVTLGSVTLDASDVLYVGAAPGELFAQLNIRIPSGVPAGNQPLQIKIGDIASPPGAFLAIAAP